MPPTMSTTLVRTPLCCWRCQKILGQMIEILGQQIFAEAHNEHGHPRLTVGPLPNFIMCPDCRGDGWWQNPAWQMPAELSGLIGVFLEFIQSLPRETPPERNWDVVPNDRRARAYQERTG